MSEQNESASDTLEGVIAVRELLTGLRRGFVLDGWSREGSEQATIETVRSANLNAEERILRIKAAIAGVEVSEIK